MHKSLYDYRLESGEMALLDEWDREKNALTPEQVSYGSKKKLWWRCARAHSYQASATSRTGEHTGCPYCSGRLPVPGQNDLSTLYPELVREWDEEKNLPLSPGTVLPSSHRYVWWRCSEGHVWRSVIFTRARGTFCSCPVCAGKVRRSKNIPSMYIPAGDAITNTKEEKRL